MSKKDYDIKDNNLLAKIVKFGVYSIAFIPLIIFSDFLSPFHFGKVIILRSIIEVLAVFYLILILSPGGKSYLPPKSRILWAFVAFAGIFGLTTLTSINSFQSFWGNLERMGGFFTFAHYLVLFIIASAVLRTKEDWIRMIQITLFVGTGETHSIREFLQVAFQEARLKHYTNYVEIDPQYYRPAEVHQLIANTSGSLKQNLTT